MYMLQLPPNMQGMERIDMGWLARDVTVQPRHLQIKVMDSLFVASNHSNHPLFLKACLWTSFYCVPNQIIEGTAK